MKHILAIQKQNSQHEFKFTVPEGTPTLVQDYVNSYSGYKNKGLDFFKFLYIIHHITCHYTTHHGSSIAKKEKDDYKGCPLHQRTLSSILGVSNPETAMKLKILQELDIIRKIGNYVICANSQHYALTTVPIEVECITASSKNTNIVRKLIKKRNEKLYVNDDKCLELYKAYLSKITLNIPEESLYSDSTTLHKHEMEYCISERVKFHMLSLNAIRSGDWFIRRPDAKSRVHTNLTNLKRTFRPFLRFDNKPFVEFDIRNSQPLIAAILIENYWRIKGIDIPIDVVQYRKDCEMGVFYDYFMDLNDIAVDGRAEFKKQIFGEVFFSKVTKRLTKLKKQFIEKYPSAVEAIDYIKGGLGSETYNQFAIQLQRKEASLIFDNVNVNLLNMGIPAFNIFDSILCLVEYEEIVMKLLLDAFKMEGLTPSINRKAY